MLIKGIQKVTLLDYPGRVACTLFTGGCNFRCPFCQNSELVLRSGEIEGISEAELFEFLAKRRGLLDGVCVTGGEPTLQPDLPEFMGRIKSLGYCVKLDTNGYEPDILEQLIGAGLVDYIAMDIKSSPEGYARTSGLDSPDLSRLRRSVELIRSSGIEHEFRTTVVRELHSIEDIIAIGHWIMGEERYFLQQFVDSGEVMEQGLSAPSDEQMHEFLNAEREFIPGAELRGLSE